MSRSSITGWRAIIDRLPAVMAELVAAGGGDRHTRQRRALAAKAATTTSRSSSAWAKTQSSSAWSPALPGRVATRPASISSPEVVAKRLGLLHELVPKATRVAVLVNPANADHRGTLRDAAGRGSRPGTRRFMSSTPAPAARSSAPSPTLVRERPDALFVAPTGFSPAGASIRDSGRAPRDARRYTTREMVEAGGLMSYGTNLPTVVVRSASIPVTSSRAQIPPICRSCSRPSSSSSSTCRPRRALGLDVPPTLLARADEVIE